MPFTECSRKEYAIILILFTVYLYFFFTTTYTIDASGKTIMHTNYAVYIIPIFLIFFWFRMVYLPGKPRLRELNLRIHISVILLKFFSKIRDGWDEYYRWREKHRR